MKVPIRWPIILGSILLVCGTHFIIAPYYYMMSERVLTDHALDIMHNSSDLTLEQSDNHMNKAANATRCLVGRTSAVFSQARPFFSAGVTFGTP